MVKKIFSTTVLLLLAFALLATAFASVPFSHGKVAAAESAQEGMSITASEDEIVFSGILPGSGEASIVRLHSYEYYGEKTLYHGEDAKPITEIPVQLGQTFTLRVKRFTNDGYDKIYDKFGVVQNGEIIADFSYSSNIPSELSTERKVQSSIKGLQVQNADDAFKLGVNHAAINCTISEFVYENKPSVSGAIEFTSNGKTYYFRKDRVEAFDAQLKELSDNGMEVTVILIIPGGTRAASASSMIHPKAETSENITAQQNATVLAPNLTNERGMLYWEAACEFLAERYTTDGNYGFLSNIVVGNEVDMGGVWNNMGPNDIGDYVDQYVRTLRATYTAFKKYNANTNVLMSLTHAWNSYGAELPAQYENKIYKGKDIFDKVLETARAEGDFGWGVAYHPYPSDLRDPRFWADEYADLCASDFDTQQITYKNIDVLCRYLDLSANRYNGEVRPLYLTEQGLNSYSEADKSLFPSEYGAYTAEKGQKLQAFAYAYSYYLIAAQPTIQGYILHRHVDAVNELVPTLSLGLWTCRQDSVQSDPLEKKVIYDVFKYIDTEKSLEYTEPLLQEGFVKVDGKIPASWEELIPDFDIAAAATASLQNELSVTEGQYQNTFVLDDFEDGEVTWEAAENTTKVEVTDQVRIAPDQAAFGERCLSFRFNSSSFENGGHAEKGILKKFEEPLDIKEYKTFNLAVNVPTGLPEGGTHTLTVIFYGERINTATMTLQEEQWNYFSVDLSGFAGSKEVEQIKIWYNNATAESFNKFLYVDGIGFTGEGAPSGGNTGTEPAQGCGSSVGGTALIAALGVVVCVAGVILYKNKKGCERK